MGSAANISFICHLHGLCSPPLRFASQATSYKLPSVGPMQHKPVGSGMWQKSCHRSLRRLTSVCPHTLAHGHDKLWEGMKGGDDQSVQGSCGAGQGKGFPSSQRSFCFSHALSESMVKSNSLPRVKSYSLQNSRFSKPEGTMARATRKWCS